MSSKPEITISATEFKAKCLNLMDRIASGSLARVRVTKRGRVTAELSAPSKANASAGPAPFHGFLKGQIAINPAFDWDRDGPAAGDAFERAAVDLAQRLAMRGKPARGR